MTNLTPQKKRGARLVQFLASSSNNLQKDDGPYYEPPAPPRTPGSYTVGEFSVGRQGLGLHTQYTDPFITEFGVVFVDASGSTRLLFGSVDIIVEIAECDGCTSFKRYRTASAVLPNSSMKIDVPAGKVLRVGVSANHTTNNARVTIRI